MEFAINSEKLLHHRGPDDHGIFNEEDVTLAHTRLSILELSELGHQPMHSSCGRYVIVFNGEIYNHLQLRQRFLPQFAFKGHSDTETIIELFRMMREKMLHEMVGMWSIIIWDKTDKKLFVSRSRFGQKPLYLRQNDDGWIFASEIRPLLKKGERPEYDATAVVEFLALGNYGHLGVHTFFRDIKQFPQGAYSWLSEGQRDLNEKKYWELPNIPIKDQIPFDKKTQKELHNRVVDAVMSQTLSDVPIGITLSGGIDSSIVAGILATYYDSKLHVFTAQSPNSKYDETVYVDAVLAKFPKNKFEVHRANLDELSIKDNLENYISIQEEPFGDPSILAHGSLMKIAAASGIKVILNGQGADELFYGYANMARSVLSQQLKSFQIKQFVNNLQIMKQGKSYLARTLLESAMPSFEYSLRNRSRIKRRDILRPDLLTNIDNKISAPHKYSCTYNVWSEMIYNLALPHLVHYDDRNAMAYGIEGRMPFLDHRLAEYVAQIKPNDFLKNGSRKNVLREACKDYMPEIVYQRKDKIGFFTPLIQLIYADSKWIGEQLKEFALLKPGYSLFLSDKMNAKQIDIKDALIIWKCLSIQLWQKEFDVNLS